MRESRFDADGLLHHFLHRVETSLIGEDFGQRVQALDVEIAFGAIGRQLNRRAHGLLGRNQLPDVGLLGVRAKLLALRFGELQAQRDALGSGTLALFRFFNGARQGGFRRRIIFRFEKLLSLGAIPIAVQSPFLNVGRGTRAGLRRPSEKMQIGKHGPSSGLSGG